MEGLRPAQLDLLARHRERALDVLLPAAAAFDGTMPLRATPAGTTLLGQERQLLISVAVSAAAAAVERRRFQGRRGAAGQVFVPDPADAFPAEVLAALRRRRLPFTAPDVELLLNLGTSTVERDVPPTGSFEPLSFAVAAARVFLGQHSAGAPVVASLGQAAAALGALELGPTNEGAALRRRIQALVAANTPGGLLDLSLLDPRDAWAKPTEEVLRDHAARWDGVQRLVALLARADTPRPTVWWRREAEALAEDYSRFGDVLRELLEPIVHIDLSTSGVAWPPGWLLAPSNETLARGATWATAALDEPWVVGLLGRLALRGAARAPHPRVTMPLSRKVAGAAVETLAAIGTSDAVAELRVLLGEIRHRELLRRIAVLVGEDDTATATRDERIRREKAREIRRKADPEPRRRQQLATRAVARELAPLLSAAGFVDNVGRTFWRDADDRVEALHCRAGHEGVTLELGIWFRFVPRLEEAPRRQARPRPAVPGCDLRANIATPLEELRQSGAAATAWFERWRPLSAVLRWLLVGKQSQEMYGPGAQGSPTHTLLTGYVARQLGEEKVARKRLASAAAHYRETLAAGGEEAERAAWVEQLEADAAR